MSLTNTADGDDTIKILKKIKRSLQLLIHPRVHNCKTTPLLLVVSGFQTSPIFSLLSGFTFIENHLFPYKEDVNKNAYKPLTASTIEFES